MKAMAIWSAVLLFGTALPSNSAQKMTVHDPLCKQITMKVVENTQSTFTAYNSTETASFLANPYSGKIVVSCNSRPFVHVQISDKTPFPDDTWFYLATRAAAAISPAPADEIETAIRSCHREALKESGAPGYGDVTDAHIECYAYSEDKISTVFIYLRDSENQKVFKD